MLQGSSALQRRPQDAVDPREWAIVRAWPRLSGEAKLAWLCIAELAAGESLVIVSAAVVGADQGTSDRAGRRSIEALASNGLLFVRSREAGRYELELRSPSECRKIKGRLVADPQQELPGFFAEDEEIRDDTISGDNDPPLPRSIPIGPVEHSPASVAPLAGAAPIGGGPGGNPSSWSRVVALRRECPPSAVQVPEPPAVVAPDPPAGGGCGAGSAGLAAVPDPKPPRLTAKTPQVPAARYAYARRSSEILGNTKISRSSVSPRKEFLSAEDPGGERAGGCDTATAGLFERRVAELTSGEIQVGRQQRAESIVRELLAEVPGLRQEPALKVAWAVATGLFSRKRFDELRAKFQQQQRAGLVRVPHKYFISAVKNDFERLGLEWSRAARGGGV